MEKIKYPKSRIEEIGEWEIAFANMLYKVIAEYVPDNALIYDAGCGKGRLFDYMFSKARKIVGKELDYDRFNVAVERAKVINSKNNERIAVINGSITDIADLKEYGNNFDIIICSHVFQHVPYKVVQGALNCFHQLLATNGKLIILVSKNNSNEISHWKSVGKEFAPEQEISLDEFQKICKEGIEKCLPIRKFPYSIVEDILLNPYSTMLNQVFQNEGEFNINTDRQFFKIIDWQVCQGKTIGENFDIHIDYDNVLKEFPNSISGILDTKQKEYSKENRILIENFINNYSYLKHRYLLDMTIIAEKIC